MNTQKPEAVWVFPDEKKRRGPRAALIVGLIVLVLLIAAGLALFLIPRGGPVATPVVTSSRTASPSPSAPATPPPGVPTAPVTTPPPVPDPSIEEFRGQVQQRLDAGSTGLDLAQSQSGDQAAQIVDSLQNDAQNLAERPAPDSIRATWSEGVTDYAAKLRTLRSAFSGGSDASGPLADARASLGKLRGLVGL